MRAPRCLFAAGLIVATFLAGCGRSGTIVCESMTQSQTWLESEVSSKYSDAFAFEFPIRNEANAPQSLRVRSIGCSCYQVTYESRKLKVGETITLGPNQSGVLRLRPPRPRSAETGGYSFSLESLAPSGQSPAIYPFNAQLRSIPDLQLSSRVILQDFESDVATAMVRTEVTHSSRSASDVDEPPIIEGWPEGSQVEPIRPLGAASELQGIWRQKFSVVATVPRPVFTQGDVRKVLHVKAVTGTPAEELLLVQRLRSGISGPSVVSFGEVKPGASVSRRIQLSARDELPFQVLTESNIESISILPDVTTPQDRHWLELKWVAQPASSPQTLQLKTNHPKSPTLKIEIHGNLTP